MKSVKRQLNNFLGKCKYLEDKRRKSKLLEMQTDPMVQSKK